MRRKRFKWYVLPTVCMFLIGTILYSSYRIWEILTSDQKIVPDTTYVSTPTMDNITPTIATQTAIIRPYDDVTVEATIPFYNQNGTDTEQQAALIYYENIYMENTGVMYTSANQFNILAVLDGTVKDIKQDSIMGNIVEIENNKNVITIYQSLNNINVKVGDKLNQGDVIGLSGTNSIISDGQYCLHFEVFKKGEIIDPEQFYLLSIDDLNE